MKAAVCLLAAALAVSARAGEPGAAGAAATAVPQAASERQEATTGRREASEVGQAAPEGAGERTAPPAGEGAPQAQPAAAAAPPAEAAPEGRAAAPTRPAPEAGVAAPARVVPAAGAAAPAAPAPAAAPAKVPRSRTGAVEASELGESISVTATRSARRTRDVPQAISVVGKEQMAEKVVFNVKDVLTGTPGVLAETKNGGYDTRLIIRGAGLKASYGVREIMVLRDGVPLTDPDSFTRFDWIDTQDVERIEISKGPGNLFSPGSAGGAVQILSRSVFEPGANTARAGMGTEGSGNLHLRSSGTVAGNALALTASFRQQDNHWRTWNQFSTRQAGVKHGVALGEGGTLESEVSYSEADLQLPGAMNEALYDEFRKTGEQRATSEAWQHSGRYSKILFVNSRLEQQLGALVLKPRLYYNQWTHLHPVTGAINETADWTRTIGTDLEAQHGHEVLGVEGTLVGGLTVKGQWNDDVRKYQYRDVTLGSGGRIVATRSDAKGALMQSQRQRNLLLGVFAQETLRPHERVLVDLGLRLDRSRFRVDEDEVTRFDYAAGQYVAGAGASRTDKTFDLPAPKVGVSIRVARAVSVYASAARASQVPSESEIVSNPELNASLATSYEAGVKVRAPSVTLDLAAYRMDVEDEIVSRVESSETRFQNAGETRKLGVEATASLRLLEGLEVGGSYGYADYTYVAFTERLRDPANPAEYVNVDRAGNRLPYVPRHQYGLFATWRHASGVRLRVESNTWGRYWLDSANTEKYRGYAFLTSAGAAWAFGPHELLLEVQNVLDERYAMQVVKDTSVTSTGAVVEKVTYAAGTPRTASLGYRYGF